MRAAIDEGLASIPENRVIRVQLSELVENPQGVWTRLVEGLQLHGLALPSLHPDDGVGRSEVRTQTMDPALMKAWERARAGEWDDE